MLRSTRRFAALALGTASLAAAAVVAVPLAAAPPLGPKKNGTWNSVVTRTDGGHQLGNPEAKVRLVEYMSYTCSHCADFAAEGDGAIKLMFVPHGQMSYEIRHLIRDPIDLTAALLANCGPADKFFANHAAIMAKHGEWMAKVRAANPAQKTRWSFGTPAARFQAIAADLDLDEILIARGYSRAAVTTCLADEGKARAMAEISQRDAAALNLPGTPSFTLDGQLLDGVHDWTSLEKALASRF